MEEKLLKESYNENAEDFLFTRITPNERKGFQNQEIERPIIFGMISKNLKGKKLLDLGCGPGIHLKEYSKRGAECFGIDLSEKMIELAKEFIPKAEVKVGNIYKIGFKDDSFDIITSSFTVDHLKDLEKAAKEIKRILKKGGIFVFSVPHPTFNMFRDKENPEKLTHNYFDKQVRLLNLTRKKGSFPDFPRSLEEYFNIFLKKGFVLEDFKENKPNKNWKKRYPDLPDLYLKVPVVAFFKWKK